MQSQSVKSMTLPGHSELLKLLSSFDSEWIWGYLKVDNNGTYQISLASQGQGMKSKNGKRTKYARKDNDNTM